MKPPKSSPYRGVHWKASAQGWQAQVFVDCQHITLGLWKTAEAAALAYNRASTTPNTDIPAKDTIIAAEIAANGPQTACLINRLTKYLGFTRESAREVVERARENQIRCSTDL